MHPSDKKSELTQRDFQMKIDQGELQISLSPVGMWEPRGGHKEVDHNQRSPNSKSLEVS